MYMCMCNAHVPQREYIHDMSESMRPPTETSCGGRLLKWLEPLRSNVACPPTGGVKKERKICWIILKRKEIA